MSKESNIENHGIKLTKEAIERVAKIQSKDANKGKHLRISVLGGGCSGFQYKFDLDNSQTKDDIKIYNQDQLILTIDKAYLDFLNNSTIDYVSELGGAFFKVVNPNASASCGCGASFTI